MDILLIKGANVMMGLGQAEYLTVPLRKGTELMQLEGGVVRELPNMTAAFKPTAEELARLNAGASLHICILGSAWAPMKMMVQDPPQPGAEPDDAEFDQGEKGQAQPLNIGQFVMGTEAGAVTVIERADRCTLRTGDEITRIENYNIGSLKAALAATSALLAAGHALAQFEVVRQSQVMLVTVALDTSPENLADAEGELPVHRGSVGFTPASGQ